MVFSEVLKKSYVGRLSNCGEVKTLQLNLCLEGFEEVKVSALGGGYDLIFSEHEAVWNKSLLTIVGGRE
ncbi:hypothetical protein P8452_57958 [Trifolium repens]|nr:hypothetical protein P8452_57958 [Trifolium repens]